MLEIKMYYTYVLQSLKDMDFYTGFTKNSSKDLSYTKKGLSNQQRIEGHSNSYTMKPVLVRKTLLEERNT